MGKDRYYAELDDDNRCCNIYKTFHGHALKDIVPPEIAKRCIALGTKEPDSDIVGQVYDKTTKTFIDALDEPTQEEFELMVNAETHDKIVSGFDYEIDGVLYTFSYTLEDQVNFADNAYLCKELIDIVAGAIATDDESIQRIQVTGRMKDSPDNKVTFELLPVEFLELYKAAVAHKRACLVEARQRKNEFAAKQVDTSAE